MDGVVESDVLVVGGGLAGMVTALQCLRAGLHVTLVDADAPQALGGLARWAFGGMALVGTPLQARLGIPDTPDVAYADWLRFGELGPEESWPRRWARHYVEHCRVEVHDWLRAHGLKFLPAVHWVERGRHGEGNRLPRYHIVWGTGRELVRCLERALREAAPSRLRLLHRQRVRSLELAGGRLQGAWAVHAEDGRESLLQAPAVVLAMGGINGSPPQVRANWPAHSPMPQDMLHGADPISDGRLHAWVAAELRGRITRAGDMWNYAAGIAHPQARFAGHGLALIPCKSALWLDHRGERIGPEPLVSGFDTHWLCERVAAQPRGYTWQLLNRRIARRELAISGAEHNPRIRERQGLRLVLETLFGSQRLLRQLLRESPQCLADSSLSGLAARMNALTGSDDVLPQVLQASVEEFDAQFVRGSRLYNDDQIRRVLHARQWPADRLRTCRPKPLASPGAGPYVAIQSRLVTRKSLGGLQTDLQSRVLDERGQPLPGLYCVGEAAGFGGGGASGRRSLEGTFLPGCILTARAAARSLAPAAARG